MSQPQRFSLASSRYSPKVLQLMGLRWLKGQRWAHPFYRALRKKRAYGGGHIDWKPIVMNPSMPKIQKSGQRVLIATSTGSHFAAARVEQTLGMALQLREADVSFLLCDGAIPACLLCDNAMMRDSDAFVREGPKRLMCDMCFAPAQAFTEPLGLPIHTYGKWLQENDYTEIRRQVAAIPAEELADFTQEDITLGEHAVAGACRFFGAGDILSRKDGEPVLRQYLIAAWLTMRVAQRLFSHLKPDVVVLHHGIYVPQGVVANVAKSMGIRLVTWHPSYRKGTFVFSHDDTYHRTMIDEPVENWRRMPWDKEREKEIMEYLASRHTGSADWIWFHENPLFDRKKIADMLHLDLGKPVIGLLTNVVWDAHLHYPSNAYPDMIAWLYDVIDYFKTQDKLQLLIRIHPAEIYGNVASQQTVLNAIAARYPSLPSHIKIIPPLSDISTYSAMGLCDSVLIYSTKTGIELATDGMPVIVAGEAWIRGKGFTFDASNPQELRQWLDRLPFRQRLNDEQIALARRYAYHFFFRRMIHMDIFKPAKGYPPFNLSIRSWQELLPGRCNGLDVVCDGILNGTPFIQDGNAPADPETMRRTA